MTREAITFDNGGKGSPVYEALNGLYLHCWAVYHEGTQSDFSFYADKLDGLRVPWWVQNAVSILAEQRTSIHEWGETARIDACCEWVFPQL